MDVMNVYWTFKSTESVEELNSILEDMLHNKEILQKLNINTPILKRKDGAFDIFIDELLVDSDGLDLLHVYYVFFRDGSGYDTDLVIPLTRLYRDFYILIDNIYVDRGV